MSVPQIFVQGYGARYRIRIMPSIDLRRLDPLRNMRRFYRLDIEPHLFGGVLFLKAWGRIGTRGRVRRLFPITSFASCVHTPMHAYACDIRK